MCVPVKFIIKRVEDRFPDRMRFESIDIEDPKNHKWFDLYKYDIPVVHVDGKEIARHRLDESDLSEAILK